MTGPLLVLIGPPAAGKSRIGSRVARELGVRFIDTDRVIVREHGPIPRIFAERGETHFRALERDTVRRALTGEFIDRGEDCVVALGGGAVLDPDTQVELEDHRVALITVTADAVRDRLKNSKRPLLASRTVDSTGSTGSTDSTDSTDSWERLVEARRPIYESLADAVWDTSHRPVTQIALQIAEWVREDAALHRR